MNARMANTHDVRACSLERTLIGSEACSSILSAYGPERTAQFFGVIVLEATRQKAVADRIWVSLQSRPIRRGWCSQLHLSLSERIAQSYASELEFADHS